MKDITIKARDLLGALREAKEAGAKLVQLAMSANVCPLDEYIGELEQEGGDDPGNACYTRFGRYIVNMGDAWEAGAEVYVLFD